MTLSTNVRFVGDPPISLQELFLLGRRVADIPAEWPFVVGDSGSIYHVPGLEGAVCRVDGFVAETWDNGFLSPEHVWFDTPYGYKRDRDLAGCNQIHAELVNKMLDVAQAKGWEMEWLDEYHMTWHTHPAPGTVIVACCSERKDPK